MRSIFETGDTVQFTFVSSVAPDAAPILKVVGPFSSSPVASITAQTSDTTHYYALYTMPTSIGTYMGEWFAEKTVSSSVYPFKKRFLWEVRQTGTG